METSKPALDAPRTIRIGRTEVGVNLVLQIVIWLGLVAMVNYFSVRHFKRWDLGNNVNLQLSGQTKALLSSLQKPVQAIVFFSGQIPETERDAVSLLREYEFASNGKLTVEAVDPTANFARAKELATKYTFGGNDSMVIFDYDGRSKFVNSLEMAITEPPDPLAMQAAAMQGRPMPAGRVRGFKGEQAMTSALIELIEGKQKKVYFVSGHGEHDPKITQDNLGRTLQALTLSLERQNLRYAELKFADLDAVPEDASALLILGPLQDFSERDLQLLTDYWNRKGRIYMNLGPGGGQKPNLNGWLAELGVTPHGDDVIRVERVGDVGRIIRAGILTGKSPILKELEDQVVEADTPIQSFGIDRTKEKTAQVALTEIMSAPQDFWGETTPLVSNAPPIFDPKSDFPPPLTLAVQVEKGGSADPKVTLETARLVLFGSADLLTDRGVLAAPAALDATVNSINWLLSRESLISIPAKTKEYYSYSFTSEQLASVGWWVLCVIPLSVGIFGLYHLWWRHGRNLFLLTAWLACSFLIAVGAWYLLLYSLGNEGAKEMPKGLLIALGVAVSLGAAAGVIHFFEQKKRLAAQQ